MNAVVINKIFLIIVNDLWKTHWWCNPSLWTWFCLNKKQYLNKQAIILHYNYNLFYKKININLENRKAYCVDSLFTINCKFLFKLQFSPKLHHLEMLLFKYVVACTAANLEPIWTVAHTFVVIEIHTGYYLIGETYFQLIISFHP